ncbi:hypothetical protein IZY60_02725 [Lutibacter sp. B2]|nr:hypothetical protein [Lutibacter sp. B2]
MCTKNASLSIHPKEVMEMFLRDIGADLIHYDYFELENDKGFGYMVFEKNYLRSKCSEMLNINVENIRGVTNAIIIFSSDAEDHSDIDGSEKESWINESMAIIEEYIIAEMEK